MLLKIPYAPQRPPVPPLPIPSPPDPESGAGGKERRSEQSPRGGPGAGPATVVGLGYERLLPKVESCGDNCLISRQSAFLSPLPHPGSRRGALLSLPASVGDLGLQGGRCILPYPRGPMSGGCGGRSVTWPPPGRGRRGPRGAVPLSPRATAFVSPRGCADHEARAPEGGGGGAGAGR